MGSFRLSNGGRIDRSQPLEFKFNGKTYSGFQGDTLASALMANAVDTVSRSFKYHRRRGLQNFGAADVSSMVQICGANESPNVLASVQPLYQNLEVRSVNCWPSVERDLGSLLSLFSSLMPSGFYYKTFMLPHWHLYEPAIRKLAGFGSAPKRESAGIFQSCFDHCDVLVVGAGPAGLMAAKTAVASGARVLLVDEMSEPGGCLSYSQAVIDNIPAMQWAQKTAQDLRQNRNISILQNSAVWGYHEGNMVTVLQRKITKDRFSVKNWKVWAKQVILATGAIERPIIFQNNDAPGILSCSAVRHYIQQFGVAPGKKAVLFVNNDGAYETVSTLVKSGINVAAVVDIRSSVGAESAHQVKMAESELLPAYQVKKALLGRGRINGVLLSNRNGSSRTKKISCDLICVSGGWNPAVHLFSQSRGSLRFDDALAAFVPDRAVQQTHVAGRIQGICSLKNILLQGIKAANDAVTALGLSVRQPWIPTIVDDSGTDASPEMLWSTDDGQKQRKSFVDLAGDVTVFDLGLALREGYSKIEHLKRYTTTGMGLDQGKTANVNAIGIVAEMTGQHPAEVGTTTFRPPYVPVEFGAIAGSRCNYEVLPYRHTPMTQWHIQNGAAMHEAGARWRRPAFYPKSGESMQDAIRRECKAVRNGAGIYDGSPLGKFELLGSDVVRLLNLVYTNSFDGIKDSRGRYGIMMNEDAIVFDDGVTFRLAENHYFMFCSTGSAPATERKLEKLINVEQPDLDVIVTPVTEQWANATVCGPMARKMLESAESDIDFSRQQFPFMSFAEGRISDIPVRIFRVSFTGELSFEINVKSRFGLQLWEYLMELGRTWEICPVGSEANHVLRVEKGFLSMAHEVDGTVDPIDLGRSNLVHRNKPDFVGKRTMEIRRRNRVQNQELIGLYPLDCNQLITEGAPLVDVKNNNHSEGFVSACVWSDACGRSIALGLLNNGRARKGENVTALVDGKPILAEVADPVFYDPEGIKLRM